MFLVECMTKCLNLAGLFPWVVVQMVVGTTTTHTLWFVVVIGLFQLTSMFLDVLLQLRHYSMVFSSFRRRLIGARISSSGGPSEASNQSPMAKWYPYMFLLSFSSNKRERLPLLCVLVPIMAGNPGGFLEICNDYLTKPMFLFKLFMLFSMNLVDLYSGRADFLASLTCLWTQTPWRLLIISIQESKLL